MDRESLQTEYFNEFNENQIKGSPPDYCRWLEDKVIEQEEHIGLMAEVSVQQEHDYLKEIKELEEELIRYKPSVMMKEWDYKKEGGN